MDIPKLFISYSHDSLIHKKWVVNLATRLRTNGVDAVLDQWELTPGDDLPHFMETQLENADNIVMICTDRYVEKANSGSGGVGYEKMIITSNFMNSIDENKIIPIIRQNGTCLVPTFLKTKLFIDFSRDDDYEFNFDELLRKLHKAPIYLKPGIGNNPFASLNNIEPLPKHDALKQLMTVLVLAYENGENYISYNKAWTELNISRIMFDLLISQAVEKKYIERDLSNDLWLIDGGKRYAIQNGIIK